MLPDAKAIFPRLLEDVILPFFKSCLVCKWLNTISPFFNSLNCAPPFTVNHFPSRTISSSPNSFTNAVWFLGMLILPEALAKPREARVSFKLLKVPSAFAFLSSLLLFVSFFFLLAPRQFLLSSYFMSFAFF